jgi:hypothetical protein
MPKFTDRKKTKKAPNKNRAPKSDASKARAVKKMLGVDPWMTGSDELEDQQEFMVTQGKIGTGKSMFSLTGSQFCPKGKLAAKKGRSKLISLDDLFVIMFDANALAGAKSLGLRVPPNNLFNVNRYMAETDSDIVDAVKVALETCNNSDAEMVVVDTISTMDSRTLAYHVRTTVGHPNQFEPYKRNLQGHAIFVDDLMKIGMHVHVLTHSKMFDEEKDKQNKNYATSVAGGGEMVPDLTGQAPKHYKRDACLQFVMHAFKDIRGDKSKLVREVLIGINEVGEGKNRYEGILPDSQRPPHLRKLLELAWK